MGLTEEEARRQGMELRKGRAPMTSSGLALAYGQTEGLVKLIADEHDAIVGRI